MTPGGCGPCGHTAHCGKSCKEQVASSPKKVVLCRCYPCFCGKCSRKVLVREHMHLERVLKDLRAARAAGHPYLLKGVTEDGVLDQMEKVWHKLGPEGQQELEAERERKLAEATKQRRSDQECSECAGPRICGQGFTDYTCAGCGSEESYANTCIPKFCVKCSRTGKLCRRCGGPMD